MKDNVSQNTKSQNTKERLLSSVSYIQKISSASKGFTDFSAKGFAIHPSESGAEVKKVSWSCKNTWLTKSGAFYFAKSFKYSVAFLNEMYGYDTASLEQYKKKIMREKTITTDLAIDSARYLLANDKQNKGLADYITANYITAKNVK